jgi:uncharacterized protein (TIGR02996 family)
VTTEDDFQSALDENPDDWQTRLVFADWLQDRGDPRADGYRALAAKHFCPLRVVEGERFTWTVGADDNVHHNNHPLHGRAMVPRAWYEHAKPPTRKVFDWESGMWWAYFRTRRECEEALVLAFPKLPAKRRAELLASAPFVPGQEPAGKKPTRRKPRT